MIPLNSGIVKAAVMAAVAGIGVAVASTASTASADVVCNRWGDCWHVRDRLEYPAGIGITFHTDAWGVAHRGGHWRWRTDHADRGFYRNGVWIAF